MVAMGVYPTIQTGVSRKDGYPHVLSDVGAGEALSYINRGEKCSSCGIEQCTAALGNLF